LEIPIKSIFKHTNSIKYPKLNIKWGQKYALIITTHLSFCTPGQNWAISKHYSEVFYFISTLDQRNEPYLRQINILEIKLPCINKWKVSIFHTWVNLLNSQDNQLWKKTLKLDVYFLTKIRSSVLACVFTQNTHASKYL